ncbi:hypothetical protein CP02DC15_1094B, partial [Chlamydia psittaci 02DC15]
TPSFFVQFNIGWFFKCVVRRGTAI